MKSFSSVKVGAVVLPSLSSVCRKRGLPLGGSTIQLRKRLKKERSDEILRCPVCLEIPCVDDIVMTCKQGHHMCFPCLVQLKKPLCPLCVEPLQPAPPGHLLRQMLEYEGGATSPAKPEASSSSWLSLYRQVQPVFPDGGDMWSWQCTHTFGVIMRTPEGRQWVRQCSRWRAAGENAKRKLAEAVRQLRHLASRPPPHLSSSSSSSSSSSEEDE